MNTKQEARDIEKVYRDVRRSGSHYFDPKTLQFFGQRLSDFKVYRGGGRVFVFADTRSHSTATPRDWGGTKGLSSFAEILPGGHTHSVDHPEGISRCWTRTEVEGFVTGLNEEAKACICKYRPTVICLASIVAHPVRRRVTT